MVMITAGKEQAHSGTAKRILVAVFVAIRKSGDAALDSGEFS